ncbi:putative carboxymuconolactone decarboxylase [Grosmannia clavigera kw1407]|uniref:Putative carboxymuconolactone decarboxylase n=1 Tax=Grosmannia clavigera (strain kw1407 / UAMH 11150) TaxID=655863 RepID=F0XM10_GROCL|nr:putative carboxymuconolactone decarboxylase [Grosmannia clavigera kw1407]EFX01450.1 putative carboxymuconolactone decarboxylase [Grosmannia clavigera kw1407]
MASSKMAIMTPEFLEAIASQRDLPKYTWYFIASTVLCVLNRPQEIQRVYLYAIEHASNEEQLHVSRRMRDALIKTAAVGGMPKTINAMMELATVTPDDLVDAPIGFSPASRSGDLCYTSSAQILQRGQSFFNRIYGKVATRVMGQMDRCGTPDLSLTAQLAYGYVLSNTDILNSAETSFVMIAGLIPQDVNPQLKGHLKGALNGGATVAEVMAVRHVAIEICKAADMVMLNDDDVGSWGWRSAVSGL